MLVGGPDDGCFKFSVINDILVAMPFTLDRPQLPIQRFDLGDKAPRWTQQALLPEGFAAIAIGGIIVLHNRKTGAVTQCRTEDGHCDGRQLTFPSGERTMLQLGLVTGFRRGFVVGWDVDKASASQFKVT